MTKNILILLSLFLLIFPKNAYAYLDPGTGSYILQIIAATFFASLFLFKSWWKKVKNFIFKLIFGKDKKSSEKEQDSKK